MRQISLKLKSYAGTVDLIHNNDFSRRVLYIMLMSLGALALCYIFILGNMVFNIVERKALEKEILTLSNEVGALELSYLSLSNKVNLDLSYSMGFKEIKPSFATRKSVGLNPSLSLIHEI
jgi:hypothetical protein